MTAVGMHEAKTHLSRLVEEVEAGGSVTILRRGRPVARLVAIEPPGAGDRGFGSMAGRGSVVDLTWDEVVEGDRSVAAMFEQ
ncbi:MAG: type II toxin-antitoxin system prevent-host-death family antitoxin [Actinomycetota bacterium]